MPGIGRVLSFLTLATLWLAVPVGAQTRFPTEGLEPRIEFWKQVYTTYGADDVIVHDRFHVNLIYAVATDEMVDETILRVKGGLQEICDNLSTPDQLSETASSIRESIVTAGLEPSRPLLEELLDRVHTQRG